MVEKAKCWDSTTHLASRQVSGESCHGGSINWCPSLLEYPSVPKDILLTWLILSLHLNSLTDKNSLTSKMTIFSEGTAALRHGIYCPT